MAYWDSSPPPAPDSEAKWDKLLADHAAGKLAWQARERLKQHGRAMREAAEAAARDGDPDGREAWFRRQARAAADGAVLNDLTVPGAPAVLEPLIAQVKDHIEVLAFSGRQGRGR